MRRNFTTERYAPPLNYTFLLHFQIPYLDKCDITSIFLTMWAFIRPGMLICVQQETLIWRSWCYKLLLRDSVASQSFLYYNRCKICINFINRFVPDITFSSVLFAVSWSHSYCRVCCLLLVLIFCDFFCRTASESGATCVFSLHTQILQIYNLSNFSHGSEV